MPTSNTLPVLSHMASVWALLVKTCQSTQKQRNPPWIGLPSVRPAPRNTSLVIRMQLTAPSRVFFRSAYPTAPKAKAVEDHFLCSRVLCLAAFASDTSKANFASGELPSPGYL